MAADGSVIIKVALETGAVDVGVRQIEESVRRAGAAADAAQVSMGGLSRYGGEAGAALGRLRSALSGTQGALASAFAPVATAVAPSLSSLCSMLTTAVHYVSSFFAVLSGNGAVRAASAGAASLASGVAKAGTAAKAAVAGISGLNSAVKVASVETDALGGKTAAVLSGAGTQAVAAANGIRTIGKEAKKAERNLSGLDEMNIWRVKEDVPVSGGGGGGGGGGGLDIQGEWPEWEELPIAEIFAARMQTVAAHLSKLMDTVRAAGDAMQDRARQTAEAASGAFVAALRDAAPEAESAAGRIAAAVPAGLESVLARYMALLRTHGKASAEAYLAGLVDGEELTAAEAAQIALTAADALRQEGDVGFALAAEQTASAFIQRLRSGLAEAQASGKAYGASVVTGAGDGLSGLESEVDARAGGAADAMGHHLDRMYRGTTDATRRTRTDSAAHIAGLETDITGAYSAMADTVAEDSAGMEADSDTSWSAMRTLLADKAGRMQAKVAETYDAMGKKVANIMAQSQKDNSGAWTAMETDGANATASLQEKTERAWEAVLKAVGAYMAQALEAAQEKWSAIEAATEAAGTSIRASVTAAWSGAAGAVTAQMNSLKNSAYSWGSDFGTQFANGIRGTIGRIASAASSAASAVRSYLHFSVPDKGPLADADAYGPDFIRLLADGMTKNQSMAARAAARVATAISAGIQDGEYALPEIHVSKVDAAMDAFGDQITAGFVAAVDRLQAIADSITFRVPAVATAGVVPYSVTDSAGGGRPNELLAAIDRLTARVDAISSRGSAQYTFIGQIDRKVLFQQVLDEGQARRGRSGQNPFLLGG